MTDALADRPELAPASMLVLAGAVAGLAAGAWWWAGRGQGDLARRTRDRLSPRQPSADTVPNAADITVAER